MRIAGSVELSVVLAKLAARRPVFHSEADFQFAFAWEAQTDDHQMQVRLETRPAPGVHLDLAFTRPDLGRTTAIELKYLTRGWSGRIGGENFDLKNHGAQDIRAYDVVKDIVRVEKFVAGVEGTDGAVVVLSNDSSYWRPVNVGDTSNAAAFRISEGSVINGPRSWGVNTGAGTSKGRNKVLDIAGGYETHWTDYSELKPTGPATRLRCLVVEVQ